MSAGVPCSKVSAISSCMCIVMLLMDVTCRSSDYISHDVLLGASMTDLVIVESLNCLLGIIRLHFLYQPQTLDVVLSSQLSATSETLYHDGLHIAPAFQAHFKHCSRIEVRRQIHPLKSLSPRKAGSEHFLHFNKASHSYQSTTSSSKCLPTTSSHIHATASSSGK